MTKQELADARAQLAAAAAGNVVDRITSLERLLAAVLEHLEGEPRGGKK